MEPLRRPLLFLVALAGTPFASRAADATADAVPLFNGRNLDGWVVEQPGQFSVVDGNLRVNRGTGWLRSADTFADFTLILEFRFLEPKANGGIFVRTAATSKADENGWPDNGYQVQCMDTAEGDHPIGTLINYGAPEFHQEYDVATIQRALKPTGEWQHEEITCRGETMEVTLNGVSIMKATNIKNPSGHIGIQGEHGLEEFRKIAVRRLSQRLK